MFPVRPGDPYPAPGPHVDHDARVVAVDVHGAASYEDPIVPPTLTVLCGCGEVWAVALDEAVAV